MPLSDSSLNSLRKEIDSLDKKLLEILQKRFFICQRIALYKKKKGLSVEQKKREKILIKNFQKEARKLGFSLAFIESLFRLIFVESKLVQKAVMSEADKNRRISISPPPHFLTKRPKKAKINRTTN